MTPEQQHGGGFLPGPGESLGSRAADSVRAGTVCNKADLILIHLNHST